MTCVALLSVLLLSVAFGVSDAPTMHACTAA